MQPFGLKKRQILPQVAGALSMDRSPVPDVPAPPPAIPQVPMHPVAEPAKPAPQPASASRMPIPIAGAQPSPAQIARDELQAKGSGISNIKNPVLRGLATAGDVVLGTFAPRAEMLVPGTEGNYAMKLARAGGAVEDEQQAELRRAQIHQTEAQAANAESLPELNQAKLDATIASQQSKSEIDRLKQEAAAANNAAKNETARAAIDARLRAAGFDPEGHPLAEDQLSEPLKAQRALTELRGAQADATAAKAELDHAKAQNSPELEALAVLKLQQAQQRLNIASARLGLSSQQFEFRSQGTVGGVAPAGTLLTEDNRPVGTANAPNVRPTGTERTRADLAVSAQEQLQAMRKIVQSRPDIFGPAAGRKTDLTVWLGSQDPQASAYRAAAEILADHAAGVFGARSQYATEAQKIAAGEFKDNPQAILAGLNQIEGAMKTIGAKGTVKTVGSEAAVPKPVKRWNPQTGRFE